MARTPLISIVTPSYNQGKFIADTINSVASQGYRRYEHIIVDGASTDSTLEVLERFGQDPSFSWTSEPDRGQTHAINKGFAEAKGDIIAYLNSDDRYCAGALAFVAEYFAMHPNCMWLCGNVLFADIDGHVFARKRPVFSRFALVFGTSSLYQPGVFLRRSVLAEFGQLREDLHTVMDLEWFCRISSRYPPQIVDRDLAIFRWHPASKSSSDKHTAHYRQYVRERAEIGCEHYPVLCPAIRKYPESTLWVLAQVARGDKLLQRMKSFARQRVSRPA